MQLRIEVDPHRVMIEMTEVRRPSSIAPSTWLEFWSHATSFVKIGDRPIYELKAES